MNYKSKKIECEAIYCDGKNRGEIHKHFPGCFAIKGCYTVQFFDDGSKYTIEKSAFERLFEPVEEKPKKSKKAELPKGISLPDWVEVGAYAYFDSKYHKITEISLNGQTPRVYFDTGENFPVGGVRFEKVKEARIVPWTGNLSFCVGKVFKYGDYTLLCVACKGDSVCFIGNIHVSNEKIKAGCERTAKELLEHGFTFADGSPCGEFEHLEYDPIDECFDWVN